MHALKLREAFLQASLKLIGLKNCFGGHGWVRAELRKDSIDTLFGRQSLNVARPVRALGNVMRITINRLFSARSPTRPFPGDVHVRLQAKVNERLYRVMLYDRLGGS